MTRCFLCMGNQTCLISYQCEISGLCILWQVVYNYNYQGRLTIKCPARLCLVRQMGVVMVVSQVLQFRL